MILRNIVNIDEAKCTGCGLCVNACAEGAIKLVSGKAKLISEVYCDGLGVCIGHCPEGAITIENREAAEFDEKETKAHLTREKNARGQPAIVCPGMMTQNIRKKSNMMDKRADEFLTQLSNWPVQLKLVSPKAPYFANADILLVADCVPFVMGDFHNRFLKGHSIAVGCPKLDDSAFYIEKLAAILSANKVNSLTVIHMEVPCCHGLTRIAKQAISKNTIEMCFEDVTIDLQGNISRAETVQCRCTV
jgi:Fe-S-cluster-containing hydrogenase component 2